MNVTDSLQFAALLKGFSTGIVSGYGTMQCQDLQSVSSRLDYCWKGKAQLCRVARGESDVSVRGSLLLPQLLITINCRSTLKMLQQLMRSSTSVLKGK